MVSPTFNDITKNLWDKVGRFPHHGICLPLASLNSEKNAGIGEFLDLLHLINFCTLIHFDIIQLLPLNDTGLDSSPYSALSSCALNPVYLSLWALPHLTPSLDSRLAAFPNYKSLPRIPYESIYVEKHNFLREYCSINLPLFETDPHFLAFKESNSYLKPYALFKVLKQRSSNQSWTTWSADLATPSHTTLKNLYETEEKEMEIHILTQYLCHTQLKTVKAHAEQMGVFLKGDIPILIIRESCDVWINRENFNLDYMAGSPPDMYCTEGQNWGFPIFDWSAEMGNNFPWWEKRLKSASEYYDIFRIDHIIGFYRIWAIKKGCKATEGAFIPIETLAAIPLGEMILSHLLSFTPMLPIGEDMGINIEEIRSSMRRLGIPGIKIPRWERFAELEDHPFIPYKDYDPLSLISISTHDSETLAQWWQVYPRDAQKFADFSNLPYTPELSPTSRYEILKQCHEAPPLFHINLLNEYLALDPSLIHPNPTDERINTPGTFSYLNWSYKMLPTLEHLLSHSTLIPLMKSLSH